MATNKNLSTTNNADNVVNSTNSKSNYKHGHRNSMNNPNTRLIRSFALFDNRDFLPRPFQVSQNRKMKLSSLTTLIDSNYRLNYMKHVKIAIQSFFFALVKENISYQ